MSLLLAIDPESGDWRLPHDDFEPLYRARIEQAKSGRAKCRMCGEMINTGSWRIGVPIKWRTYISSWNHPPCFYMKDPPINLENNEVYGWNSVEDPTEMITLGQELSKTEPPAHLGGEVNVEDESFLSIKKQKNNITRIPAPNEMTLKLLPFQEEGHAWMLERENSSPERGGILADEMGLGKTIQTIALIVSGKNRDGKNCGPTLIIAPSSAMLQWQDEIIRSTYEDTLSVLVYQSNKRKTLTPADILKFDVVLTSYPILENEYRQALNAQKVTCEYCSRKFLARKLIPHHKYFCGPEAQRTARLEKTERKQKETTQKAMRTLRIGVNSAPTPTAIYRDLMLEAGRTPSSFLVNAEKAREIDSSNTCAEYPNKIVALTPSPSPPTPTTTASSSSSNVKKKLRRYISSEEDDDYDTKKQNNKKVSFSNEADISKTKRNSAMKAQKNLITTNDKTSNNVIWYGKDIGLFWKMNDGDKWLSVEGEFEEVSSDIDRDRIVLQKNKSFVRLAADSLELSYEGKQWVLQTEEKDDGSFWLSSTLNADEEDDSDFKPNGRFVGKIVARRFDNDDILGQVIAYAKATPNGDPPLWRVRHLDGDVEDLDLDEMMEGMKLANDIKKLNLSWLRPMLKKKKQSKDYIVITSSSSSSSSDDESVIVDYDYKNGIQEIDNDDEVIFIKSKPTTTKSDEISTGPRFVPQTWGLKNAPKLWLDRMDAKEKQKSLKKQKPLKKSSNKAKKKDDEPSDDDDDKKEVDNKTKENIAIGDSFYAPAGDVVDDDGVDLNRSLLHCIGWHRIILDEAHKIKERTNSTAKSVFSLRGKLTNMEPPFPTNLNEIDNKKSNNDKPKKKLDPKAPKRAKSAYQYFCEARKPSLKESNPELPGKDLTKLLSEQWKTMDSERKIRYEELAEKDKERYKKEMKSYVPPEDFDEDEEDSNKSKNKKQKTTLTTTTTTTRTNAPILFDTCHRWALTGTPLMNRLGDLYSLVRFIRVSPYSYYFCKKDCTCRLLQWTFGWDARYCTHCGHTPMSHYSYFNKAIMNPVNRNGYVGAGRRAMLLLRDDLLGGVMLRRTKLERKDDLNLPPLTIETTDIELSSEERDFYESVYKLSQAKFDTFVAKGTVMNNYAHVFQLLSRLRQAADHPYLIIAASESLPSRAAGNSDICRICMMNVDDVGNLAVAKCRHTFHRECVEKYIEDFEEGQNDGDNDNNKKKKKKMSKKTNKKKSSKDDELNNDDNDDETNDVKELPKCPSCHVPLTVTLRVHGGEEDNDQQHENEKEKEEENNSAKESTCVICFDRPRSALLMPCGHAYMCYECASGLENKTCPVCRTKIEKIVKSESVNESSSKKKKKNLLFGRKSILQKLNLNEFHSSSKLDAIVKEVEKVVESPQHETEKIIVFSQFTTFLDLIQWRLQSLQISGVVKLVGSLNMEERRAVLKAFKTDPKINVILMSLKAGGEGLNLQEATVVLSCDPWWNPSVELQAFHRAHRIGQTRSVRAVRFVTKHTIEERMVELQLKKSLIFEGAVEGNESSLSKLTQEDLRFLFQR